MRDQAIRNARQEREARERMRAAEALTLLQLGFGRANDPPERHRNPAAAPLALLPADDLPNQPPEANWNYVRGVNLGFGFPPPPYQPGPGQPDRHLAQYYHQDGVPQAVSFSASFICLFFMLTIPTS